MGIGPHSIHEQYEQIRFSGFLIHFRGSLLCESKVYSVASLGSQTFPGAFLLNDSMASVGKPSQYRLELHYLVAFARFVAFSDETVCHEKNM